LSGNPLAIGIDVAKGVAKAQSEQAIRDEVAKTQGATGFEVFGSRYTQEKTGDNMSNGNFFSNLASSFSTTLGDVAQGLTSFAQPVNTIAGFFGSDTPIVGPTNRNPSITGSVPRENRNTGTIAGNVGTISQGNNMIPQQAFIGGVPGLIGTASRFLRSPGGAIGTGGLLGTAIGGLTSAPSTPRITRRMRSEVRRLLMLTGGNFDIVAQFMNQSGKYPRINFTPQVLMAILIKRFRNDGPFVTKSAIRKTRSTVRKLKSMQNLLKDVAGTTTRRRTTGMRKAGSSNVLIKN
tara:strand:+ start:1210 stop:2085 length:876 start_codon:yes stop_codon:yes gene_type:complete